MREIEFRGKRKDNGEWVYGDLFKKGGLAGNKEDHFYIVNADMTGILEREVISETVGQYIGLKDKNGVKIFEGDIVKSPLPDRLHPNGKIRFEEMVSQVFYSDLAAAFWLSWKGTYSPYHMHTGKPSKYEVIGNIHDNPELLDSEVKR